MGGCNMLWGSFAKVASRGAACWQWVREAVFSAGLKRKAWWARSHRRQQKTAQIKYSGNLSAVGGENSQRPDYSQWDMLAPTGDIFGKMKKTFEDLLSLIKILSGQEKDLQELAGWCSAFQFQEEKKTQKLVGTQIKDQLDACCSIKDFFLSSHSNYRILMVNKLAGGQKVSGERLLEPTNLSGGASLDFFKLEGDSWHRISFPYDCCCVKWDWYTRNTEVEKAPEAFLLPCEKREAYRICWDIITITWFPQFVAASLSRSLFKDDWHAGLHSSSFIARQTPGRS